MEVVYYSAPSIHGCMYMHRVFTTHCSGVCRARQGCDQAGLCTAMQQCDLGCGYGPEEVLLAKDGEKASAANLPTSNDDRAIEDSDGCYHAQSPPESAAAVFVCLWLVRRGDDGQLTVVI